MVSGIVERRQTLPILGNILLKVADKRLSLVSTDLEIEMNTELAVEQAVDGEITVAARKFSISAVPWMTIPVSNSI